MSSYEESFAPKEVISDSRPQFVLPFVFAASAGIIITRDATALSHPWIPILLIGAGCLSSTITWWLGRSHPKIVGMLQVADITFYSSAVLIAAALSQSNAQYAFAAFYSAMCIRWGIQFSYSLMGSLNVLGPPLIISLVLRPGTPLVFLFLLSGISFVYLSKTTEAKRRQEKYNLRSQEALKKIDKILFQHQNTTVNQVNAEYGALFHEIRNCMGPILWNLRFVQDKNIPNSDICDAIEDSISSTRRAIFELSTFLDRFRNSNDPEPRFFLKELDKLATFCPRLLPNQTIEIEPLPPFSVRGTLEVIRIAILTLIDNAFEAGASSVRISGDIVDGGGYVRLSILDNGPGLALNIKENLFKPFNTFGKENGMGLGLYLAKRTIEPLFGKLTLLSSTKQGTCFAITLPILKKPSISDETA